MPKELALPLASYPAGAHQIPARNVPDGATVLYFEFARCTTAAPTIWPNVGTTLAIMCEGSTDGITWTEAGRFTAVGGIHVSYGRESLVSAGLWPMPPFANRRVRATVTISGGPLRTKGMVEFR